MNGADDVECYWPKLVALAVDTKAPPKPMPRLRAKTSTGPVKVGVEGPEPLDALISGCIRTMGIGLDSEFAGAVGKVENAPTQSSERDIKAMIGELFG